CNAWRQTCGSSSVSTFYLADPVAELQEEAVFTRWQHPVNDVILTLVGIFDRFEILLIVALADVDRRPILRLSKPNVGKNAIVGNLADREVGVTDLVTIIDREEQLLPELPCLLFERSATARFGSIQFLFRQLASFVSNLLVEEL